MKRKNFMQSASKSAVREFSPARFVEILAKSGLKRTEIAKRVGCNPTDLSRYSAGNAATMV